MCVFRFMLDSHSPLVYLMLALVVENLSMFFFFKQKTAYEMHISDWSSDVCSSDLAAQTDVAAPCAIDFCSNGASPEALAAAVICLNRAAICSGGTSRPRSVAMAPGCTAAARIARALWRRSNSTAKRILAVFERP